MTLELASQIVWLLVGLAMLFVLGDAIVRYLARGVSDWWHWRKLP